ncbi:MAG: PEP-CTERM sorting domain-containing protein [bacterium]
MKKTILALVLAAGITSPAEHAKAQDNATFYTTNSPGSTYGGAPVSAWQGLKNYANTGDLLFVGTSYLNGLVYTGPISGAGGSAYIYNAPGSVSTSIYGGDAPTTSNITMVGSYNPLNPTNTTAINGFVATGVNLANGTMTASNFINITNGQSHTYVHSVMGGYAVGNSDNQLGTNPVNDGQAAFIYNISNGNNVPVAYAGAGVSNVVSTTLYAIWWNGGTSYTIAGGYDAGAATAGFVANWDSGLGTNGFNDWTSYSNVDHFEGISSLTNGIYTLSAAAASGGAALLTINGDSNGFSSGQLTTYSNSSTNWSFTSDDSCYGNYVVGIGIGPSNSLPVAYSAVLTSVPEPSQVTLLLGGIAGFVIVRCRKALLVYVAARN